MTGNLSFVQSTWQPDELVPDTPWWCVSQSSTTWPLDVDRLANTIDSDWKIVQSSSEYYLKWIGDNMASRTRLQEATSQAGTQSSLHASQIQQVWAPSSQPHYLSANGSHLNATNFHHVMNDSATIKEECRHHFLPPLRRIQGDYHRHNGSNANLSTEETETEFKWHPVYVVPEERFQSPTTEVSSLNESMSSGSYESYADSGYQHCQAPRELPATESSKPALIHLRDTKEDLAPTLRFSNKRQAFINKSTTSEHMIHLWLLKKLAKGESKVVRWKDRRTLTFEIVDPELIAKLWAEKKGNRIVSYDNFTRAIRYSRQRDYFKKIGKQRPRTYTFAKKAVDSYNQLSPEIPLISSYGA